MADEKKGMAAALDILSRRDRSEQELRGKLRIKEIPDEQIDAVVARLKELRYLDDRRLAESLATAALTSGRGYGMKLALDLARRGIPREIADETLSRLTGEFDQRELVRDLLLRKFPRFDATGADNREKARVMNYLLRRGFSYSAVFDAMKNVKSER
jgi:regulatory protein